MTGFPTAGHLASWAGTAPGKQRVRRPGENRTKTRPGNRYLKGALGIAALAASPSSKGTYFSAKYKRIAARRGPMKALVAVEHAMLVAAWNMLCNGEFYRDPGADYFTRLHPERAKNRAEPFPLWWTQGLAARLMELHGIDTEEFH